MSNVRQFIDFWVENSVHAAEQYRGAGASQSVAELTRRCIDAAKTQGISEANMTAEVGPVGDFLRQKLGDANQAETDRHDRH